MQISIMSLRGIFLNNFIVDILQPCHFLFQRSTFAFLLKHRSLGWEKPSFTDKAFEAPEIN